MKYKKEVYRSFTLILQFGINMLVPIFICAFIGYFIDRLIGTSFCFVILFFIGALAGFTNVFKMARGIYAKSSGRDTLSKNTVFIKTAKDNSETELKSADEHGDSGEDEFSAFDKLAGLSKKVDGTNKE